MSSRRTKQLRALLEPWLRSADHDESPLPGERIDQPQNEPDLPAPVADALAFYSPVVDGDWGVIWLHRCVFEDVTVFLIWCTTDGEDGYFELMSTDGAQLCARTCIGDSPTWMAQADVRNQFSQLVE